MELLIEATAPVVVPLVDRSLLCCWCRGSGVLPVADQVLLGGTMLVSTSPSPVRPSRGGSSIPRWRRLIAHADPSPRAAPAVRSSMAHVDDWLGPMSQLQSLRQHRILLPPQVDRVHSELRHDLTPPVIRPTSQTAPILPLLARPEVRFDMARLDRESQSIHVEVHQATSEDAVLSPGATKRCRGDSRRCLRR